MELEIGAVVEGKVKSLTKFGAFVLLPDHSTGMVHISEVAHTFVSDIHDYLAEGDTVRVMIIGRENGKTNLSIKRTLPRPQTQGERPVRGAQDSRRPQRTGDRNDRYASGQPSARRPAAPSQSSAPQQKSFDDMLKQFMTESDSKMSSIRQYSEHKTKNRRR